MANSVFTHLPEDMQFEWLEELQRIVKPDGILLLNFHGDFATKRTQNPHIINATSATGFHYVSADVELTPGLPVFYQNTFHTKQYIETQWGKYFDILATIPQGIDQNQDLAVCRRR